MINAIILAAGQSKRMGSLKALLKFRDETFLQHIVSVLRSSNVDRITVVLGVHADKIRRSVDLSAVTVVMNRDYEQGQLSSLVAAIDATPQNTHAILVALTDMPFITQETVNRIVRRFTQTQSPIIVPVLRGKRGHPVLFANSVFDDLRNAPRDQGARYVLHSNEDKVLEVSVTDEGIVTSIDTPDDYQSHLGANP